MDMTRFIRAWADAEDPVAQVSDSDLKAIEREFNTQLTPEYREPTLRYGTPLLSGLLPRRMEDEDLGWDVTTFIQPRFIIDFTKYFWLKGLPRDEIVIAEDGSGRVICLPIIAQVEEETDYPIALYDPRTGNLDDIAPSFGEWIAMMADLSPDVGVFFPESKTRSGNGLAL